MKDMKPEQYEKPQEASVSTDVSCGSQTASFCRQCGRLLTRDEIAVTKKLINRGATEFCCTDCLAAWFEVRPEDIRERIAYFRSIGCTLFSD